jgi:hypothetical protein
VTHTGSRWARAALVGLATALTLLTGPHAITAQAPAPATGVHYARIDEADVRAWLTYLSSDLLQGRQVFTEGYGLAASYVAGELKDLGVKPLGDEGTYLQAVTRRGYHVTRHSSVTVEVAGVTRTFRHDDHVRFAALVGRRQSLHFSRVEFAGNDAASAAPAPPVDTNAATPEGAGTLVLYSPLALPRAIAAIGVRGAGGTGDAVRQARGGAAAIGYVSAWPAPDAAGAPDRGSRGGRGNRPSVDITTVGRVDDPLPPLLSADDAFFEFLFSGGPSSWPDVEKRIRAGEPVPSIDLANVRVTIDADDTYDVVTTERTENVVGLIEGSDPRLKSTYVLFGAHLDHMGYVRGAGQANGRVNVPVTEDPIWNGADDDGSGSTALLAMAKAFMTGPRPKRSIVFVWHAGEEAGLLGSQYMAAFPVVPIEAIQVELNIDMIGRNRDNDPAQGNTVYVIGADRISTDLHNLLVETNEALPHPLTLDYEYNDPADPNSFYTRSDHYSYASQGIPIAFFFTGEHPDYHANTDSVEKILFPKLVRIAQFIYEAGFSIADSERPLERDNLGPRSGRDFHGLLPKARVAPGAERSGKPSHR